MGEALKVRPTVYGPWDYRKHGAPFPYDDTPTYRIAGEWVSVCSKVEDWGCGTGWMSQYVGPAEYVGVDGAWSRFAHVQTDLRTYTSNVPAIVMRHVLEHNTDWRQIAQNMTRSWHERAALVLFIPPQPEDMDTAEPDWGVPDIAVSGPDLFEILGQHGTEFSVIAELHYPPEDTIQWGWEGVVLMER